MRKLCKVHLSYMLYDMLMTVVSNEAAAHKKLYLKDPEANVKRRHFTTSKRSLVLITDELNVTSRVADSG